MIEFYRDFLDGPLYVVVMIFSVIFIMAILGFMIERKNLERDERNRMAVLSNDNIGNNYGSGQNIINPVNNSSNIDGNSNLENANDVESIIDKPQNAATSSDIPQILDLNVIDNDVNKK